MYSFFFFISIIILILISFTFYTRRRRSQGRCERHSSAGCYTSFIGELFPVSKAHIDCLFMSPNACFFMVTALTNVWKVSDLRASIGYWDLGRSYDCPHQAKHHYSHQEVPGYYTAIKNAACHMSVRAPWDCGRSVGYKTWAITVC